MKNPPVKLAIIGGSRAYDLLSKNSFGAITASITPDTPFGKSAPVHFFKGDGFNYCFLSRHGEKTYEVTAPDVNYRANIWALKELGIERIVSWSQPGAINSDMKPGDFIITSDIIDQTKNRESTFYKGTSLGFIRMGEPFCAETANTLRAAVAATGNAFHDSGIYCCTEGPRLETPAEIRMFKSWGADLVGMTFAPEAFLARELEICYAAVCMVSNFAEGVIERDFKEGVLFEGMLSEAETEKVEASISLFPQIMENALQRLSGLKRGCKCGLSMERYRRAGKISGDLLSHIKGAQRKG